MKDCKLGNPQETVKQVILKNMPETKEETWQIIDDNKEGLLDIIKHFGGNNNAVIAEEMIKERKSEFHELMNKIWFSAPENWYLLHQFVCWELFCDLLSDGIFYNK
jgi:hypothetical protein